MANETEADSSRALATVKCVKITLQMMGETAREVCMLSSLPYLEGGAYYWDNPFTDNEFPGPAGIFDANDENDF